MFGSYVRVTDDAAVAAANTVEKHLNDLGMDLDDVFDKTGWAPAASRCGVWYHPLVRSGAASPQGST